MTTFLEKILAVKEREVAELRPHTTELEAKLADDGHAGSLAKPRGFAAAIGAGNHLSVIAEVKRASPSKGLIAPDFQPVKVAQTYAIAGAAAISVLTDAEFFQGSLADLSAVRSAVDVPVLRKDFIIDEAQILDARVAGADAILLIVAALSADRLMELARFARSLELDTLIEVHSVMELDAALAADASVVGVNNRNLHTFEVSLETTVEVLRHLPSGVPAIAESGIHTADDARRMAQTGAVGLLVGESLMRAGGAGIPDLLRSFQVPRLASAQRAPGLSSRTGEGEA